MLTEVAYAAEKIELISKINTEIINPLIYLLVGAAVLFFIYGVVETLTGEGYKKDEGKTHMLWGIIGIFIMVSAIGILNVICNTIGCN